jgi:hypothetical protein
VEDANFMSTYLWTVLLPVFGWFWKIRRDDLASLRQEIIMKADKKEVETASAEVHEMSLAQAKLREDMHKGFSDLTQLVHQSQLTILRELASKADK